MSQRLVALRRAGSRAARLVRRHRRVLLVAATLLLTLAGAAWWAAWTVPLPARLHAAPSPVVRWADGGAAHVFLSPDDKYRMAVRLDAVDPDHVTALLRYEDKRFFEHGGVDLVALTRACVLNLRHGRVVSGASTLTMQLVRMLEPRPRTVRSKLVEMLRAWQLELHLEKDEILAAYLSHVPYGRNVEGVEAAAFALFGHSARDLSADEIAVLLAIPQQPTRRHPRPRNLERLRTARDEIAEWLLEEEALPTGDDESPVQALARVRGADLPQRLRPLPRAMPHAATWLRARHRDRTEIATTIDRGLQRVAERRLRTASEEMDRDGIHAGAVVLVEHGTGLVRALVGNFDFWADEHGAQIVGFDTPRSPGSALKPFIHALALDRGLALPRQLVVDVPVSHAGYSPDNYDGRFAGLVRLEDALSRSLNIPYVNLLGRVGVERFLGVLRDGGVTSLRPEPGYYGLSAAIGAVEITPLEVAALYATLARDGRHRPLRWLQDQQPTKPRSLWSPGASYSTRLALEKKDRPDFPSRRRFTGMPASIHWKTGTSYGHKDAWAAGSGPRYTAVTWLGNFDNQSSSELVGSEAAGPVLFDLLEAVADRSRPPWRSGPTADLFPVDTCSVSGHRPSPACPRQQRDFALRSRVPTTTCPYHVEVDVDLESGLALTAACRSGRSYETRTFLSWPGAVRRFLSQQQRWLPAPPTLAPGCAPLDDRSPPSILSPPAGEIVLLVPGVPSHEQELPLEAETGATGSRLTWFVDGELVATVQAHERAWWAPEPGTHELLVMDDAGRSARRRLVVGSGT